MMVLETAKRENLLGIRHSFPSLTVSKVQERSSNYSPTRHHIHQDRKRRSMTRGMFHSNPVTAEPWVTPLAYISLLRTGLWRLTTKYMWEEEQKRDEDEMPHPSHFNLSEDFFFFSSHSPTYIYSPLTFSMRRKDKEETRASFSSGTEERVRSRELEPSSMTPFFSTPNNNIIIDMWENDALDLFSPDDFRLHPTFILLLLLLLLFCLVMLKINKTQTTHFPASSSTDDPRILSSPLTFSPPLIHPLVISRER